MQNLSYLFFSICFLVSLHLIKHSVCNVKCPAFTIFDLFLLDSPAKYDLMKTIFFPVAMARQEKSG